MGPNVNTVLQDIKVFLGNSKADTLARDEITAPRYQAFLGNSKADTLAVVLLSKNIYCMERGVWNGRWVILRANTSKSISFHFTLVLK